jgi:hypothetical protein
MQFAACVVLFGIEDGCVAPPTALHPVVETVGAEFTL